MFLACPKALDVAVHGVLLWGGAVAPRSSFIKAFPGYGDLGSPLVKKNERGEEKERRGGKKK